MISRLRYTDLVMMASFKTTISNVLLQRALHDYFEDSGGTATGGASCGDENSAVDKRATSV